MGGGSCENVKKVVKNIFFYAEGGIVVDEDENANEEHIFLQNAVSHGYVWDCSFSRLQEFCYNIFIDVI